MKPEVVILLAEDNEESIMTISEYLEARGYKIFNASNGLEALEKAREIQPDLILMDIQMPVMDGLEAIHEIRNSPQIRHTPIIAMTAMAMPGDKQHCLEAGANTYISKPVRFKSLLREIDKILG